MTVKFAECNVHLLTITLLFLSMYVPSNITLKNKLTYCDIYDIVIHVTSVCNDIMVYVKHI